MDSISHEIIALLPRLRRLAYALLRSEADADDLVQLTVERALSRKAQWQPDSRLDSWMFRIMKNAHIDQIRRRARQARVLAAGVDAEAVGDGNAAVAAIEARSDRAAVDRILATLPEEQQLAVALVLIDGLSYREAADILAVPVGTLTSRLVRARAAIMAGLKGQPE